MKRSKIDKIPGYELPMFSPSLFHTNLKWVRNKSKSKQRYYWHSPVLNISLWEIADSGEEKKGLANSTFPFLEVMRKEMLDFVLTRFASHVEEFGGFEGSTKTAVAIREVGMKRGLQGIFARFLWNQLMLFSQYLNFADMYEYVLPACYVDRDVDVENEFLAAGRTDVEAKEILTFLGNLFTDCYNIVKFVRYDYAPTALENVVSFCAENDPRSITVYDSQSILPHAMYLLNYQSVASSHTLFVTGRHFVKLVSLYNDVNYGVMYDERVDRTELNTEQFAIFVSLLVEI